MSSAIIVASHYAIPSLINTDRVFGTHKCSFGHPFGMIQRRVSRDVTSRNSAREALFTL
jgi:hypothetical protein